VVVTHLIALVRTGTTPSFYTDRTA